MASKPIKDDQVRTLIAIRDEHGMDQETLYHRIGSIIGRAIARLKHLSRHEAKRAIDELTPQEIKPSIEIPHHGSISSVQEILKSVEPVKSPEPKIEEKTPSHSSPPSPQPIKSSVQNESNVKTKEQELAEKIEKLFGKKNKNA